MGEEELDRIFSALSNRTRRAILARLRRSPARIGDIAEPFEMSQPAVSKHMKVLERAGLIRLEVDGRVHRCSLAVEPLEEAERWLRKQRVFWEGTLDRLASHVEDEE